MAEELTQVVFTDKARCRDCYRCLRACPVKAIEMHENQARVVPGRCIACGTCIRECPQHAKSYRDDLEKAIRLIREGHPVAASVAPSFAALWDSVGRSRLPSVLRKLGFAHVAETAIGAYQVARATAQHVTAHPDASHICSACPVVVNYVERYQSDLSNLIVPVVSPMLAHAMHIKKRLGPNSRVVFIGPCVAKKAEAERPEDKGWVDCALTFDELLIWMGRENIDINRCEESTFDEAPAGDARFFPVPGGLARTAEMKTDLLDGDCQAVGGYEHLRAVLDHLRHDPIPTVVEPLFCSQGCLEGAGMPTEQNIYELRHRLLRFAAGNPGIAPVVEALDLNARYKPRSDEDAKAITEEMIRQTLERTGKAAPEDQLNCGACGYPTCREKAIAVIRGYAEPQMCIPYMRRLAEQRTDRIIETSPNGIVMLDKSLRIMHMNTAFRQMFMCSESVLGKPISYLMDPEAFERLAGGEENVVQSTLHLKNYNLVCHQIAYALPEDDQYVGIFVNVTSSEMNQQKLEELRQQTQAQARELLDHQVNMAQQIARLLGESSARGEVLVKTLLALAGERRDDKGQDWLKNTYTSK